MSLATCGRCCGTKIDACEGLIQIVGNAYGAEPPTVASDLGRVSYTQFEFLYARQQGKTTWLIFPADGCTRDKSCDELDMPLDPNQANPEAWQRDRRELQVVYRTRLNKSGHLRHEPENDDRVALAIERLRNEFELLRQGYRRSQRRVAMALAIIAVLVIAVGGVVWFSHSMQQASLDGQGKVITEQSTSVAKQTALITGLNAPLQDIKESQPVTRERIRTHLQEAARRVLRDLSKKTTPAPGPVDVGTSPQFRLNAAAIIEQHIVTIEATEKETAHFRQMKHVLANEGVTAAIAYLDRYWPDLSSRYVRQSPPDYSELEPFLIGANLKDVDGQPDSARMRFEELLAISSGVAGTAPMTTLSSCLVRS